MSGVRGRGAEVKTRGPVFFLVLIATAIAACNLPYVSASPRQVTGPYIAHPSQPISPWEDVTIVTNITDVESGTRSVTLFYSTNASTPRQYLPVNMNRTQGDDKNCSYTGQIPRQANGTIVYYFTKITDGSGNTYESSASENDPNYYRVIVLPSIFQITYLGIEKIDPRELTADIRVTFRAYLQMPDEPPRISVHLQNDFADVRTIEIPLSRKYEYEIQTDLKGLQLLGDASLYPLDHYYLDLRFAIFFKTVSAIYSQDIVYFAQLSDNYVWALHQTSATNSSAISGSEISVHIDFDRRLENSYYVILPLILGFIILGGTPMLSSGRGLQSRLTIYLALFVSVMGVISAINKLVPARAAGFTFAEIGFTALGTYVGVFVVASILASLLMRADDTRERLNWAVDFAATALILYLFFYLTLVRLPGYSYDSTRTLFNVILLASTARPDLVILIVSGLVYGLIIKLAFMLASAHSKAHRLSTESEP